MLFMSFMVKKSIKVQGSNRPTPVVQRLLLHNETWVASRSGLPNPTNVA